MTTPVRPRTGFGNTTQAHRRRRSAAASGLLALVLWSAAAAGAQADTSGPDIVSHLNAQRAANGIPAGIAHDAALTSACTAHNAYMALHPTENPHEEIVGSAGYTAAGRQAAMNSVMYGNGGAWTATRNPFENAPQHLHQLLGPRLDRMGAAESSGWVCATTLASRARPAPASDTTYTYPGNGVTGWPISQVAVEGPFAGVRTGPYLYVLFDGADLTPFDTAIATSATLTSPFGMVAVDITDNRTPGQGYSTGPGMQVIPRTALIPGTTYTATVAASVTTRSTTGAARTFNRSWSFTTDAPPNTTIDSGPTGTVNTRSATFTFSASKAGSTFECSIDAGAWTSCSSPRSLSALPDGAHTFSVRARNAAGTDATPATRSWTIDATPPPVVTLTAITPASPANANAPVVRGAAEAGSNVRLYSGTACTTIVATGSAASFASPGFTITVPDNSSTMLRAVATDQAGNSSPCPSTSTTYVEDSAAPAAPAFVDVAPNSPANDNSPEVKGTAEAGSTVRLYAGGSCTGTVVASGPAAAFASPGITIAVGDNSTTTLRATATDAAANVSACSPAITYVEDSTAPAPPNLVGVQPNSPANDNAPRLTGTAAAGATVRVYAGGSCTGSPVASGTAAQFASPGLTIAVAADSSNSWRATASDQAGNASACSTGSITYVEDSTAPAAVTLTSNPASPANANAPRVVGFAEAGSTVKVYTDGACAAAVAVTGSAAALASPGLPLSVADNSTTPLRATATDPAGNVSPCPSLPLTYVEDSAAPGAVSLSGFDPASPANANVPKVRGTAEAGSTVRLYAGGSCTGTVMASGPAAALASPGIPFTVADNSTTTLRATTTDPAGNVSACSTPIAYVEDSTISPPPPPPPPPGTTPPPPATTPPPPPPASDSSLRARFVGPVTLRLARPGPTRVRVGSRLKVRADVRGAQRLRYRWRRNGRTMPRMTLSSYRVRRADRGRAISCRVTAYGADGVAVSRTSSSRRIPRR